MREDTGKAIWILLLQHIYYIYYHNFPETRPCEKGMPPQRAMKDKYDNAPAGCRRGPGSARLRKHAPTSDQAMNLAAKQEAGVMSPIGNGHISWQRASLLLLGLCAIIFAIMAAFLFSGQTEREIRRKADSRILDGRKKILSHDADAKNRTGLSASIRRSSTPLHTVVAGGDKLPARASDRDMIAYISAFVKKPSHVESQRGRGRPVMSFSPIFSTAPPLEKIAGKGAANAYYPASDLDFDAFGRPLRWLPAASRLFSYTPRAWTQPPAAPEIMPEGKKTLLAGRIYGSGQERYARLIEEFSSRFNLDRALVFAIVHSESNFTPHLVSSKSAMGLMQLMPSTASGEVHRFLYGRRGAINYEQLRVPEINIRYGTAYLHILFTRYFSKVRDPMSREYCAVAAYNMGPNGFLKIYGKNQEEAIANINSMTSDELFASFAYRLPQKETRSYVIKVRNAKLKYMMAQQ